MTDKARVVKRSIFFPLCDGNRYARLTFVARRLTITLGVAAAPPVLSMRPGRSRTPRFRLYLFCHFKEKRQKRMSPLSLTRNHADRFFYHLGNFPRFGHLRMHDGNVSHFPKRSGLSLSVNVRGYPVNGQNLFNILVMYVS
jgi:hypothetical protein